MALQADSRPPEYGIISSTAVDGIIDTSGLPWHTPADQHPAITAGQKLAAGGGRCRGRGGDEAVVVWRDGPSPVALPHTYEEGQMGAGSREPLADAVIVSGKVVWAPPLEVGMPCRCMSSGFEVAGRITEILDPAKGEVLVLADPAQDSTATQAGETWQLFTPGQPFRVSWHRGLHQVQRADGQWEGPVVEVIREKKAAVPGWQLSDAVRCDPAYRNRVTGGGVQGTAGRFVGRGENGLSVERRRWTTTLTPDALDVLRALAEANNLSRNEVVERLLLSRNAAALVVAGGAPLQHQPETLPTPSGNLTSAVATPAPRRDGASPAQPAPAKKKFQPLADLYPKSPDGLAALLKACNMAGSQSDYARALGVKPQAVSYHLGVIRKAIAAAN